MSALGPCGRGAKLAPKLGTLHHRALSPTHLFTAIVFSFPPHRAAAIRTRQQRTGSGTSRTDSSSLALSRGFCAVEFA